MLGMPAYGLHLPSEQLSATGAMAPIVAGSPTALPFPDSAFDHVVSEFGLDALDSDALRAALAEVRRVAKYGALLVFDATRALDRRALEAIAIACGLRRHPGLLRLVPYEALQAERARVALLLEVLPEAAWRRWPPAALERERDLHMDMLRESGSRSDAHLARYQKAADLVRPGDVILDAACGLGYGSWILSATGAARVVGVDRSSWAIDYARDAFRAGKLGFEVGELPACLEAWPPHSVDLIASFETLEHVSDPGRLLEAFARLLTPAGRLVVSVPHDWSDETGTDPNPHHFDVYDWPKLKALVESRLLLEGAAAQTADRAKVAGEWSVQPRRWTAFDPDLATPPVPAEWLVAIGMKAFCHPDLPPWSREWRAAGHPVTPAPVDYARMLQNPWLSRALLDQGGRLANPRLMLEACQNLLGSAEPFDRAAALVVLCYRDLRSDDAAETQGLLDAITRWRADVPLSAEPHAVRWHVSLTFVAARLSQKRAALDEAAAWFEVCVDIDAGLFGPLLLTKTVEACCRLGVLRAAAGRRDAAEAAWRHGVEQAERVLAMPADVHFGPDGTRLPFVFREIGQVCEWGQACADALEALVVHHGDLGGLSPSRLLRPEPDEVLHDPPPASQGWRVVRFEQANPWCRQVNAREILMHPVGLRFEEQPSLVVEIDAPPGTRAILFMAEACNDDPRNGGAILLVGWGGCPDEELRPWILLPRQPVLVSHPAAAEFAGVCRARIVVMPQPTARSSDYLGVRLTWIGTA
jgi:ubiquinone/menaquinone biosynthesis C-methylase UbiE